MVQKKKKSAAAAKPAIETPKRRGRPRAFEPDVALSKAMETFRDGGFAATSLDDLSAAMGINRPSLYGTFGDKRALFLKAYDRYGKDMAMAFAPVFEPDLSLREALERVFRIAINVYLAGEGGPRGCFTVMTATSEAMADPEIRAYVQNALSKTLQRLTGLIEAAVERGELPPSADVAILGQAVMSGIESIAIRSRAGMPRPELENIARGVIRMICGPSAKSG